MAESDTRLRILDAAESLFTEQGFEATTMRQITGVAGVNLASVNYHFGSKEALIREVFRRRLTWLNQRRLQELEQAHALLQEEHALLKKAIRFCSARRRSGSPSSTRSGAPSR